MRPNQLEEITIEEVNNLHVESSSFNHSRDSPQACTWGPHVGPGSSINCPQAPSFINEETSMNLKRDAEEFQGGQNPYVIGESITSTNEEPSTGHGRSNLVPLHGKGGGPPISGRGNTMEENDMVVDEEPSPLNNGRNSEQMKYGNTLVSDRSMETRESDMAIDDEADDTMMDLINDDERDDELEMKNSPFTYMSSLLAQWDAEESRTKPFIRGRIKVRITHLIFFCRYCSQPNGPPTPSNKKRKEKKNETTK